MAISANTAETSRNRNELRKFLASAQNICIALGLVNQSVLLGRLANFDAATIALRDVTVISPTVQLSNLTRTTINIAAVTSWSFGAPCAPAVIPITPASLDGFATQIIGEPPTATIQFVPGPGTPPNGSGSVQLATGANGDGAAQLRQSQYNLVPLADITSLSYNTYISAFGSGGQAPYLVLNINFGTGTSVDELLFFEPVYQDGTYSGDPVPNQGSPVLNTWQTWDALRGGWHTGGGPPLITLAHYITLHPNARIINSPTGGGLRIVAGLGAPDWNNFVGNVSSLTVGVNGVNTTYAFQP